jgi:hypothetical protein
MVDLMSVEGGPVGGTSPAKLVGWLIGFLCILLAIVALIVTFTLPNTISCHDGDIKVKRNQKSKKQKKIIFFSPFFPFS